MTIICFVVDNSAPMNQRTYQGTTLLDSAKTIVETFFKVRMNKCRVDRYFVFTLNRYPYNVKLSGWRQTCDLQTLHTALSKISSDGTSSLSDGISSAFQLLNLNRMQVGFENYGMGLFMSFFEPAVVIVVSRHNAIFQIDNLPTALVPGGDLTSGSHRWDYRLHGILLQNPGLIDTFYDIPRPLSLDSSSPAYASCKQTGGDVFVLADLRAIPQCVEVVVTKCQPGVVIDLIDTSNGKDSAIIKQFVHVKQVGRVGSFWPIPEGFWPSDELLLTKLPTRPSNPLVHASLPSGQIPKLSDCIPIDKYELEPTEFTHKLIEHGDPQTIWPCVVPGSGPKDDAPFGYFKTSPDQQVVHLHVLPYNFKELSDLLVELQELNGMRMNELWTSKFANYLSSIPRYYYGPISKAFERLGFQGVIKPEALDRTLPYQLKNHLQKLRHAAKQEYDRFAHTVEVVEPLPHMKLVQSLLPPALWNFTELRALGTVETPANKVLYENPSIIPRRKLRKMLPKLRRNLDNILEGIGRPMDREGIHNQALSEMGDYVNYKFANPQASPLRELMPSPERLDTFGNPFRRKSSTAFVADEVFVEDIAFSGPAQLSALSSAADRRRRASSISGRVKGPLPLYITFRNWRRLSRCGSTASSSPQRDEFSPCPSPIHNGEMNHMVSSVSTSPPMTDNWRGELSEHRRSKQVASEEETVFKANQPIVRDLIDGIRKPSIDGGYVFDLLSQLSGSLRQKYVSVSFVMAEALRFKRVELYKLFDEWRSCLNSAPSTVPVVSNGISHEKPPPQRHFVNGLS